MNQLSMTFDYDLLDPDTRFFVQAETDKIRMRGGRIVSDLIGIGHSLNAVRDRLGHGEFLGWLHTEFGWSQSTAYNYMSAAEKFPEISNDWNFEARALYILSAKSVPQAARDEAIERAKAGEPITHQTAQEIASPYKPAPARPKTTVFHCGDCGQQLPAPAWHCDGCHAHWPMAQNFCLNCGDSGDAPTSVVMAPPEPAVSLPGPLQADIDRINGAGEITKRLMAASVSMLMAVEIMDRLSPETLRAWAGDFPNLSDAMNRVMDSAGILVGKCRDAAPQRGGIRRVV